MDYYGDNAHFVGFPAESGNGNMLRCYGFVVVNAQDVNNTARVIQNRVQLYLNENR